VSETPTSGQTNTESVLLGRLFDRVDLIKPVSNVHPYVHMSVCPQKLSRILMKFGMQVEVYE